MDFKYNGRPVTGDRWKRACGMTLYNEYGQIPHVMFIEEHIVEVDGESLQRPAGELSLRLDADTLMEEFPILNEDGTPSEQMASVGTIGALLTSAYVYFAEKRDAYERWLAEEEARLAEEEAREAEEDDVLIVDPENPVPEGGEGDAPEEPGTDPEPVEPGDNGEGSEPTP